MKIALVHNTYRESGGEDVVFECERHLLERAGHTVIPYHRSNTELRDESLVDRIGVVQQMVWSVKTRSGFSTFLNDHQPDVVHIHNTFMATSPSIYWACM